MFARKNAVDGTRMISTPSWTIRGSFSSSRSFPVTTVTSKSAASSRQSSERRYAVASTPGQ